MHEGSLPHTHARTHAHRQTGRQTHTRARACIISTSWTNSVYKLTKWVRVDQIDEYELTKTRTTWLTTKTCLYNFDPLKPHFYIVKLEFTGVYIIFLISAQKHRLWVLVRTVFLLKNIDCGHSLEPPLCFWAEIWKVLKFLSENFQFLVVKFSVYLNRHVFVMLSTSWRGAVS